VKTIIMDEDIEIKEGEFQEYLKKQLLLEEE